MEAASRSCIRREPSPCCLLTPIQMFQSYRRDDSLTDISVKRSREKKLEMRLRPSSMVSKYKELTVWVVEVGASSFSWRRRRGAGELAEAPP